MYINIGFNIDEEIWTTTLPPINGNLNMNNEYEDFQKKDREAALKWLEKKEKQDAENQDSKHSKNYSTPYIKKFGDQCDYFE